MAFQEPRRYAAGLQDRLAAYGWIQIAPTSVEALLPLFVAAPGKKKTVVLSIFLFSLLPSMKQPQILSRGSSVVCCTIINHEAVGNKVEKEGLDCVT